MIEKKAAVIMMHIIKGLLVPVLRLVNSEGPIYIFFPSFPLQLKVWHDVIFLLMHTAPGNQLLLGYTVLRDSLLLL